MKVIERRGIQCTCLFLDHGDQDTVPVEDLREIPPKFLDLPAQVQLWTPSIFFLVPFLNFDF